MRKPVTVGIAGIAALVFSLSLFFRRQWVNTPYGRWLDQWSGAQVRRSTKGGGYYLTNLGDDVAWGASLVGVLLLLWVFRQLTKE